MIIGTWIDDELVMLDTEQVWATTFAHWDSLVDTGTAARIASAVVRELRLADEQRSIETDEELTA